jgi:hypothetical protein
LGCCGRMGTCCTYVGVQSVWYTLGVCAWAHYQPFADQNLDYGLALMIDSPRGPCICTDIIAGACIIGSGFTLFLHGVILPRNFSVGRASSVLRVFV